MNRLKNKNILIVILIIIIVMLLVSCIVTFTNKNEKVDIYTISGESENFYYTDAMFITSNIKNIYIYGNISVKGSQIKEEDITYYELNSGERLIIAGSSLPKSITIENAGYNELFPKEVIEDLDNWYLEITYKVDDGLKKEKIKLNNNYIMDKVEVEPIA